MKPPPIDNKSRKHHYVPVYHINHFTDTDGFLWWYDKAADEFCRTPKKRKAPSRVFYTMDGNTSYWGAQRNTYAETAYSALDDITSFHFNTIAREPDVQNGITPEQYSYMSMHMMIQHLRVPANDALYNSLVASVDTWGVPRDHAHLLNQRVLADDTWRKVSRGFAPVELLNQLLLHSSGEFLCKMYHFTTKPILILTDNPVVFLRPIVKLGDFLEPCAMAVTGQRLYFRDRPGYPVGDAVAKMLAYNVLSLDQAVRYACTSSLEPLQATVKMWKSYRGNGFLPNLREQVFRLS